jgi:inner membrane protease subunit 2
MLRRLRDVALSVPVVITVNDCVATVARADAADLPVGRPEAGRASDGARGVPSEVGPSSSRGRDAAWVVLDRTATRLLTFARGDMVYLKTPSDPNVRAVRRLVALEGDWVTAADSDEVQKIPKGHCRLEHVVETRGFLGRETWHTGTTGTKWRGAADAKAGTRGAGDRDRDGNADGTADAGTDDFDVVPVALLDARVPAVLWPPSRFGLVAREIPPGRVLMRDDGTE